MKKEKKNYVRDFITNPRRAYSMKFCRYMTMRNTQTNGEMAYMLLPAALEVEVGKGPVKEAVVLGAGVIELIAGGGVDEDV